MTDPHTAVADAEPVQWLTAREMTAWRTYLDAARQLFHVLGTELQASAGIPLAYYEILVTLSEAPERTLRMGTLARRVHSSSSKISHSIARLEECGWVRREPHPSDRRATLAVLTESGAAALAEAAPGHVKAVRENFLDRLTSEQLDQLADITRRVLVEDHSPADA